MLTIQQQDSQAAHVTVKTAISSQKRATVCVILDMNKLEMTTTQTQTRTASLQYIHDVQPTKSTMINDSASLRTIVTPSVQKPQEALSFITLDFVNANSLLTLTHSAIKPVVIVRQAIPWIIRTIQWRFMQMAAQLLSANLQSMACSVSLIVPVLVNSMLLRSVGTSSQVTTIWWVLCLPMSIPSLV